MFANKLLLSFVFLLGLAALGCARSADTPDTGGVTEAAPPAPSASDAFRFEVGSWEGPTGEEGYVTVAVEARGDHKINLQYPQRVKLDAPPSGMRLPMRELKLADAQLESDKRLSYTVPVTADRPGEYELSGIVKLSVCSATACHIHRQRLVARVTVQ